MKEQVILEIADHIPGVIFAKSRDGKFVYANREYERLFQVKRDWLIGKTNYDFMSHEVAEKLIANDRIVLEEGIPHRFDEQVLIKGEWRVYSCIKFPLRDETGFISGMAGISTDITESKRNEEALKETNARLAALVNAIPDAVIFKDTGCRHLLVNKAAEKVMGLSGKEAAGKTNEEVLPPETAAMCRESDKKAMAAPEPVHAEESVLTEKGEKIHLDTIKAPIHDEQGKLMGLVVVSRDITERKRYEKALQQSEQRFREFFAHVPVGMFIVDADGRFLHANEFLCRFFGYSEEELLASNRNAIRMLTYPEDMGESLKNFEQLMSGKIPEYSLEKRYTRRDGRIVWGRVSATCRLEDGSARYIGIVEDIDDRKRTEDALRQSEERFRMFADFTYDWEYWIGSDGSYIYVSPACEKVTGYGPEYFRDTRRLIDLAHPQDRKLVAEHIKEHLRETEQTFKLEYRIIHRNGEERWIAHVCQPVHGKDGRHMGRRASNRDITERKNAELQMRLFIDLIEQSNDAISIADLRSGRIIFVNEKHCRNLGYTREELLTMHPEDTSTRPPGFFNGHFRELRESGSILVEDVHRRKDGTTFPVEVSVKYTRVNEQEFAVAVIRDISERKRLEQELHKAQRLESIGLLAGGIAHDFNNILTAILGNITLARMSLPPGEKAAARLAVAEKVSVRARSLSQQLITFAKGGAPITETIRVPHLIREQVELALQGSKVKGEYFFPDDLRPVEADEGQLSQVVSNLVVNAVEAMPEGGILTVTAANESLPPENTLSLLPGEYVRIDIRDQGIGIPAELQDRIFDPYFTMKEQGSGLGLAIAFSIVKRHGGTITVDSAPGKGSTFSIFLPVSQKGIVASQEEDEKLADEQAGFLVKG